MDAQWIHGSVGNSDGCGRMEEAVMLTPAFDFLFDYQDSLRMFWCFINLYQSRSMVADIK